MAYTLTFAQGVECRLAGHTVSSPYMLSNGDSIEVSSVAGAVLTVNGTQYTLSSTPRSIDISDADINITVSSFPPALSEHYLTINFSAAETPKVLSFGGKILRTSSGKIVDVRMTEAEVESYIAKLPR